MASTYRPASEGAIEFSGNDGVVLGAPFSATGRMPLAWAVPAWLAGGAASEETSRRLKQRCRRDRTQCSRRRFKRSASRTRNVGDRDDRYRSPRGRAATQRCRGHGHHRGCRGLGRRSRLTQQAPTRLRFDRGRLEVAALDWKDLARSSRPRALSAFCQAPKESFGLKGPRLWRCSG